MEKSKTFRELVAWQKAHQFALEVYKITKKFSREELFCLTSQFRKAAVSIPANIAEGYKKRGKNDKVRFFNISEGSLEECKYYLILALDLDYIDNNDFLLNMAIHKEFLTMNNTIQFNSIFCLLSSVFSFLSSKA